jgi:hypothetical protein
MRHADGHSKLLGYCFDGFPIYGPFGYTNPNSSSSGISRMASSYELREFSTDGYYTTVDTYYGQRPYPTTYIIDLTEYDTTSTNYTIMTNVDNPYCVLGEKTTSFYNLYEVLGHEHGYYYSDGLTTIQTGAGFYIVDYVYKDKSSQSGNGIYYLDEYNGRICVTPEYPNGTYAYFLTYVDNTLQAPAYPYIIGNYSRNKRTYQATNANNQIVPGP